MGDHLDLMSVRIFWSAIVLASWGCFGSLFGDGVNLATGIVVFSISLALSFGALWTARGRGRLRICLAAVLIVGLLGVGSEAIAVGAKLDNGENHAEWIFIFFPLLLAIPITLSVGLFSCFFLGGGRRGSQCGQLWDCSRPEPAEGIALALMTILVEMILILILMTANLFLPLLETADSSTMTRPYSLCLLPIEILLILLTMIFAIRSVKTCVFGMNDD